MAIKTNLELVAAMQNVVDKYKTVYMWGVFGSPVTESIIAQKAAQYPSWYTAARQKAFRALIGKGYFGFDCVNLIKGLMWGWSGDASKAHGGAVYATNGVPDINANTMITKCSGISTNFSSLEVGEALWCEGHIGVYIGNGKGIECTPSWSNNVQITAVKNMGTISGLNARQWTKHGKLPYITYLPSGSGSGGSGGTTGSSDGNSSTLSYAVNDSVQFAGGSVYASSTASAASSTRAASKCKVTSRAAGAKHPYHLVSEDGKGVYGWVDASAVSLVSSSIKAGDKVKVKSGAKDYSGGGLASFVYSTVFVVRELNGDRAVIAPSSTGAVTAAVKVSDLIKQ